MPAAAAMLGKLLQRMGHNVAIVNDAAAALRLLEAQPFDVVISDVAMPEMDGYVLARRIRQSPQGQDVLLVALTGYGQESDRLRAQEAGFDRHLVKPAGVDALTELLRHARQNSAPPPGRPALAP